MEAYGRLNDTPSSSGSRFGVNVPVQVAGRQLNVPVSVDADGYGQGGQYLAAQVRGTAGSLPLGKWSDSILNCFSSISVALITVLFPCIQFALVTRRAAPERGFVKPCGIFMILLLVLYIGFVISGYNTQGIYLFISLATFLPIVVLLTWLRYKLRQKYEISGSVFWDFIVNFFCPWCALCQEARHVERDYAVPV